LGICGLAPNALRSKLKGVFGMNVIKIVRRLQAENAAYANGIKELRQYIESPKFHVDTTVQVSDIFARLQNVQDAVNSVDC